MIIKGYIFTYLYIFILLGISSLINKYVSGTISRKLIHIGVSFCYFIFYKYFGSTYHILIPPFTFIILNYISYKKDLFKGMEENKSLGTVYYAVSVFIMGLITYLKNDYYYSFGISWFIMAFGDGLAPIISKYIKSKKIYKDKTIVGTFTVFLVSIIVMLIFNGIFNLNYSMIEIGIVGIISSILELIGIKGLDNLYLPLGVSIVVYLLGVG